MRANSLLLILINNFMKRVKGIGGIFFNTKDPEENKIEHCEPVDKEFEK
jgi:hypothetical protein